MFGFKNNQLLNIYVANTEAMPACVGGKLIFVKLFQKKNVETNLIVNVILIIIISGIVIHTKVCCTYINLLTFRECDVMFFLVRDWVQTESVSSTTHQQDLLPTKMAD